MTLQLGRSSHDSLDQYAFLLSEIWSRSVLPAVTLFWHDGDHKVRDTFISSGDSTPFTFSQYLCIFFLLYLRIRKAGYPIRHTFKEFIDRYHMLSEGLARDALDFQGLKNAAVTIAKRLLVNSDWQVGKTKIFLKVSYLQIQLSCSVIIYFIKYLRMMRESGIFEDQAFD